MDRKQHCWLKALQRLRPWHPVKCLPAPEQEEQEEWKNQQARPWLIDAKEDGKRREDYWPEAKPESVHLALQYVHQNRRHLT